MRYAVPKSKPSLRWSIAAALAVLLLFATNPGRARHERRIEAEVRVRHPVASLFGAGTLAARLVDYRSYGVLSVGRLDERVVSVGVLGMVFVRGGGRD